ncbi:MAG: ABC transporter ATP-binding protein/permease [Tolypothrix brevis GSE-NOS-MK-07-07A]|nr:ABC transporter ATP-binding protein/permease [Tolypothrix brevis GSE-NOS-MK-07-07A]
MTTLSTFHKNPDNHGKSSYPLQRLLNYGSQYRRQIWLATLFTIINTILDLAPPWIAGIAIDIVVQKQESAIANFGVKDIFWQLVVLSVLTVIIWIFESLSQYGFDRIWRNLAQNIQHNLRLDAYNHLQELESAYFEEKSTGALMSILNDDINQLEDFLNYGVHDIIGISTSIIILVGGSFLILPASITLVAMLPMPFIIWGSLNYQKNLESRYADVRERVSFLNSRLENNLSGINTIKSFTAEGYESCRLTRESEAYRRSNTKAIKLSAAFMPLIRMLVLVGFVALLFWGGLTANAGKISIGTYSAIIALVQSMLWPLVDLGEIFDKYQRSMASTNRVMNLLDTPIRITTGDISLPTDKVRGEVDFAQVSFAYPNREAIIKQLSLHIPAGETIAIIGTTGSGKSTLTKLLLRFYDISSGTITIDGIDIKKLDLHDLRRSIGLVSQDVFLFHGTVAENIAYGSFDASDRQIVEAAKVAEAHDFVIQLPQGYETIVGERGQKLSGGQRQRIAIARAVLKNPPILILDEATSSVDNETEAAIQRSLERITVNRTTIAIAHRLSTIRNASRIYVMEYGELVESGTHEELLEKDGIYANLWRVQSGEC